MKPKLTHARIPKIQVCLVISFVFLFISDITLGAFFDAICLFIFLYEAHWQTTNIAVNNALLSSLDFAINTILILSYQPLLVVIYTQLIKIL